jgi:hypothetical protein
MSAEWRVKNQEYTRSDLRIPRFSKPMLPFVGTGSTEGELIGEEFATKAQNREKSREIKDVT